MSDADDRENQLLARVAWLSYSEDLTQAEIGQRLGLTRLRVNRLLRIGRERGIVRVVINTPFRECVELESRLVREFGLERALVIPTPEGPAGPHEAIGRCAGEYVSTALRDGQSLGVGWGNTIRAAITGIVDRAFKDISVTSLYGGVPRSPVNPFDSTAMFARRFQAKVCNHLAAPMFVSSPHVRDTIAGLDPFKAFYRETLGMDMIFTAVGDITARATNIALGAITLEQRADLARAGAVGEFLGRFLDARGRVLDHPINACSMSPDFEGLLKTPRIVLASGGAAKASILRAVLAAGHVHVFATDVRTAQNLLDTGQTPP